MGRAAIFAVIASLALIALPSVAAAQAPGAYQPPAPTGLPTYTPAQVRRGFVIGFGIGGGSINAVDDSGDSVEEFEGMSFELHIGGMISPRFALLGEVWGIVHQSDEDDVNFDGQTTFTHNIFVLAAQYWLSPRFWIKGGIGRANYTVEDDIGVFEEEEGSAIMGGLGYELSHSRTFAIDLQLRFGVADYEQGELHNGAVAVGINWY